MLDIQRISKTFNPGTVNEKKAITDLSLHLNKGEFVTVIGSNGAGKSTRQLLRGCRRHHRRRSQYDLSA